jgi:hypothetical protein
MAKTTTIFGGRIMKKLFKNPLRIIDASIISLCLATCDWATYRKAKGAVTLHLSLDGDNLMPFDAYLSTGKVHDVRGMAELCGEHGRSHITMRNTVTPMSLSPTTWR